MNKTVTSDSKLLMTGSIQILRDYYREMTTKQRAKAADDAEHLQAQLLQAVAWAKEQGHTRYCSIHRPALYNPRPCDCGLEALLQFTDTQTTVDEDVADQAPPPTLQEVKPSKWALTPETKEWLKQFWCGLRGHGKIDLIYYGDRTAAGPCMRCKAMVEL